MSKPRFVPFTRRAVVHTAALGGTALLLDGCGLGPAGSLQGAFGGPAAAESGLDGGQSLDGGLDGGLTDAGLDPDAGLPDGGGADAGVPDGGVTPQCAETEDNILGPFYRANAPFRSVLAAPSDGEWLVIEGTVSGLLGGACSPLTGAEVDIWHANATGDYDMTLNTFPWRGRQLSAAGGGAYRFETILPGRYLNGNQFRPTHIHFRVSGAGFQLLTTQLYFEGDPFIPVDPFVRASLVKPLVKVNGVWQTRFDIVLGV